MALNIPLYRPGEAGSISPNLNPMLQQLMAQRFKPQELELQNRQLEQNAAHQRAQEQLWQMQQQKMKQEQQQNEMLNNLLGMGMAGGGGEQSSAAPQIENMRNNPMLRELFKKKFGIDPFAETPEQRDKRTFDLFKQKEQFKKEVGGDSSQMLTTPMKTKLQNVITGVDSSLPVLNELIKQDKVIPTGFEWFHPDQYADYHSTLNGIIEPLIGGMGLNVTDETKKMMAEQVTRKTNESVSSYKNRLKSFIKDLERRKSYAHTTLKSGRVPDDLSSATDEELERIASGGQ